MLICGVVVVFLLVRRRLIEWSWIELYNSTPLFPGQNEADERDIIFRKLGSPNLSNMPKLTTYPEWNANIPNYPGHPLKELVPRMDNDALDLLGVSLIRENDV